MFKVVSKSPFTQRAQVNAVESVSRLADQFKREVVLHLSKQQRLLQSRTDAM